MKRWIAALTALLLIMPGCSLPLGKYPRAEPPQPVQARPVTLGITIPDDAGEAVEAAVITIQAKLIELSGGSIKTELYRSGDVSYDMQQGEPGLYLLDAAQAVGLDERLSFIRMPFLFETPEQLLAVLNSESGEIRGSAVTGNRLGGEILGVYYGGTSWFLGKTKLYDEIGFYSTAGVRGDAAGNACFAALGADTIVQGNAEELFAAFAKGEIKYCEMEPTDEIPPEALEKAKNLELTNHRFNTEWMILRDADSTLEPAVRGMIKEAFAYTVIQHDTTRRERETERQARLEEETTLKVDEKADYADTRQMARRYYRTNWQELGIPQKIWDEIVAVRGY